MTKLIYKTTIALALLFCTFAALSQNSKYYDYAGKFKIQFPGTPKTDSQNMTTDMGAVTLYQFMYETSNGVFMVSYVDYPADKLAQQDKKELLNKAKNGFVNALKLNISEERFMTYAKHPGVIFLADDGTQFSSMRDYLVENRLYQLGIFQVGAISDEMQNDFFDSFELVR